MIEVNNNEFEIYVDGVLHTTVHGFDELDDTFGDIKNKLVKEGCKELYSSTAGYYIYVNYHTQKCTFIAYKQWSGFKDCNGNKIYDGDLLQTKDGYYIHIGEDCFKDGEFYYRYGVPKPAPYYGSDTIKKVIEDMNFIDELGIVKVKDVFETFS